MAPFCHPVLRTLSRTVIFRHVALVFCIFDISSAQNATLQFFQG